MENGNDKNGLFRGCTNSDHGKFLCAPSTCTPDSRGLGPLILENMRKNRDNDAQIDADTGLIESHAEILSRCIRVAQAMKAKGVTSEDVISICSGNNKDCYIPFIAGILLGAKVAPLDPALLIRDAVHLTKLTTPRFIFCDAEGEKLMQTVLKQTDVIKTELVAFDKSEKSIPFSEFQISREPEDEFEATVINNIRDTILIMFTSGTTGLSKGVCLSHYSLLGQFSAFNFASVNMAFSRMYWITGISMVFAGLMGGGCWVLSKNYEIGHLFKIVQKYKISLITSSPFFVYQFTENANNYEYDISSVKLYLIVGSPIGETKTKAMRNFFSNAIVLFAYGQTETTGVVTSFNLEREIELINTKHNSCGRVQQGFCLKIVDIDTGSVLGPNQPGELRVKSNYIMNGYFKNPKVTAEAFDEEGYLCTGDIMYYDEDYCFFFVDRMKDLIKFRGWQISPVDLEEFLISHPDVLEAAVIGIPNEKDGDHATGIVTLRADSTATAEQLTIYVNELVPDLNRLRGGVIILKGPIPKTVSHKMRRRYLRTLAIAGNI